MSIGFKGVDLTSPINRLRAGFGVVCVNVRRYLSGGFALRNKLTSAIPHPGFGSALDSKDE